MKLTDRLLRRLVVEERVAMDKELKLRAAVRQQLRLVLEDADVDVGKDIKGTAASEKATEKLEASPAIKKALDQITSADGLAAFIQDVISTAAEKGMDQSKVKSALKKVASTVMSVKK